MIRLITQKIIEYFGMRFRKQKYLSIVHVLSEGRSILDVGVWCKFPEPNAMENWLEKQPLVANGKLLAVGLEKMSDFALKYPHVLCVQADGRALPFVSGSVDIVVSNAVLEHVPAQNQDSFVREMVRVCRERAFLSVPDRFCPLEIHSRIPVIHWLPNWRKIFNRLSQVYWSDEKNLSTIFTKNRLRKLLQRNIFKPGKWVIKKQRFSIIPVNLLALYTATTKKIK